MSKLAEIQRIIELSGIWAHGGDPEGVAVEWRETCLSTNEIEEWLEAGCFSAEAAFALDNEDITPEQASARREGFSLAYWFSNGDMSLSDVKYFIENANDEEFLTVEVSEDA